MHDKSEVCGAIFRYLLRGRWTSRFGPRLSFKKTKPRLTRWRRSAISAALDWISIKLLQTWLFGHLLIHIHQQPL